MSHDRSWTGVTSPPRRFRIKPDASGAWIELRSPWKCCGEWSKPADVVVTSGPVPSPCHFIGESLIKALHPGYDSILRWNIGFRARPDIIPRPAPSCQKIFRVYSSLGFPLNVKNRRTIRLVSIFRNLDFRRSEFNFAKWKLKSIFRSLARFS